MTKTKTRIRRTFTSEYKLQAVQLVTEDGLLRGRPATARLSLPILSRFHSPIPPVRTKPRRLSAPPPDGYGK